MDDITQSLLKTESVSVGYGKKVIVGDVSFNAQRGEIITLIGPNGSGKSTVLKSIASQLSLISGTVFINGKDSSELSEKMIARQLSVMLTGRINSELMTCGDVVESGRYPYTGMLGILTDHDREIVGRSMELTGTSDLRDRDFTLISDGQRQRILLAKAVCQEPDLLILDEPTSFLDIKHKLELLEILKKLVRTGNTGIVMSLHELDLAMKISDKVICIKDGRADRIGTPEEIFTSEYIEELYDITDGSFNTLYGSAELPAFKGEPEVFVIGGGGYAADLYRRLHRLGIPFAAGVINENDIEYPIVSALASAVITEKAFEPVSEEAVRRAAEVMRKCRKAVCMIKQFGSVNAECEKLLIKSKELGIFSDAI